MLTVDQLRNAVQAGRVDTVILALTDMQGRLQGKRLTADHFLGSVLEHGAEACNYLLAVDVEMNTVDGYAMSSWERGYGDFEMRPDLETLRTIPWHEGTALCLADLAWADHSPVVASPRQILRAQLDRLAERDLAAFAGTELEFIVFKDTYEQAFTKGYRGLVPANQYNNDYSLLGGARVEKLLRRIRNQMGEAGLAVESSKGECNDGQHEINFRYGPALRIADEHAIYKNGAKEIAAQDELAITFMAKYDAREGSSCHIHLSVRGLDDAGFERFIAGQLACMRELTLFYAPNINSYKRFAKGSFAPTAVAWGRDNRTCSVRVVGHGESRRLELRLPGADVNPYLALAAMVAAGLHGLDAQLELEPPIEGNAYEADKPHVPRTLTEARRAVRGQRGGAVRVRRGGRRALPQRGAGRARGLRVVRHRLGASTGVRTAVIADSVFAPVQSTTAFEETLERLGTAIKLGLLPPGTRLPAERELCEQLGIARSTLRQALTALVQSGHLRAVRGRGGGTFVADAPMAVPRPEELVDWRDRCDVRLSVELGVAVLAAERADAEAVAALSGFVDAMAASLDDFTVYRRADVRFHVGLAEATGSRRAGGGDDRGTGRDDRPDQLHRAPAGGPGVVQRTARAARRLPRNPVIRGWRCGS